MRLLKDLYGNQMYEKNMFKLFLKNRYKQKRSSLKITQKFMYLLEGFSLYVFGNRVSVEGFGVIITNAF